MFNCVLLLFYIPFIRCVDVITQDLLTPIKKYGEGCGYSNCPSSKKGKTNVHIVPHAHAELGYSKNFDDHYTGRDEIFLKSNINMKRMLDSTISELWAQDNRKFTISDSELPFFFHWWLNRDETVHRMVYQLVRQGRLHVAGGGWGMADEGCTSYHALIDMYTYSLRKLNAAFLSCGRPLVSWQADTFGHSREFASLLAQMGFDGVFINPISFDDELLRMRERALEFVWRGSDDLGTETDIFTHKLFDGYWSPPGFCFGSLCADPLIITSDSLFSNVHERVDVFLESILHRQSPHYATDHVMVVMGQRFGYYDAPVWFANIDQLINKVNAKSYESGTNVHLMYSSPACYLRAVHEANPVLPIKQDDFMPLAYDHSSYMSGMFTSRPNLKYMAREGHVFLQIAKQLDLLANWGNNDKLLEEFHWIMGVLQDHNIISGASRIPVKNYYVKKMYVAIQRSMQLIQRAFNKLRGSPASTRYFRCAFNISACANTDSPVSYVVIYNPLAWPVSIPVRLPVANAQYAVYNPAGIEIESGIAKIPSAVLNIPQRRIKIKHELVFIANNLPALGYRSYYIEKQPITKKRSTNENTRHTSKSSRRNRKIKTNYETQNHPKRSIITEYLQQIRPKSSLIKKINSTNKKYTVRQSPYSENDTFYDYIIKVTSESNMRYFDNDKNTKPSTVYDEDKNGDIIQDYDGFTPRNAIPYDFDKRNKPNIIFSEVSKNRDVNQFNVIPTNTMTYDFVEVGRTKPSFTNEDSKQDFTKDFDTSIPRNTITFDTTKEEKRPTRVYSDFSKDSDKIPSRTTYKYPKEITTKSLLNENNEDYIHKRYKFPYEFKYVGIEPSVDRNKDIINAFLPPNNVQFETEPITVKAIRIPKVKTLGDAIKSTVMPEEMIVKSNEFFIKNKYITINIEEKTRKINKMTLSNGVQTTLDIQFYYYASDDPKALGTNKKPPGAYIFRPMDSKPEPIIDFIDTEVYKTDVVEEIHTKYADFAAFSLKLYKENPYIEIDWVVGPIDVKDDIGKDVFIRYTTDLVNNGIFFTDANGRQTVKRIRNTRATYTQESTEYIAGNFYPVTSRIYIQDLNKNQRFSIFNDRSQGGASLIDGTIDLMVHRRIITDDNGIRAYLNETIDDIGITVRGTHYLYLGKANFKPNRVFEKRLAKEIELKPQVIVSYRRQMILKNEWFKYKNEYSALKTKLPIGVHLLTIQKWDNNMLLRLENYLEKCDVVRSGIKKVDLKILFHDLKIISVKETTLAGNIWLKDWVPLQWQTSEKFVKNFNDYYGNNGSVEYSNDELKPIDDVDLTEGIVLVPQQIRTFVVAYEYIVNGTM